MISRPTVLILGAGASNPYGYPLGNELVGRIGGLTGPGGGLRTPLLSRDAEVQQFHQRLIGAEIDSIDDFLESNPTFQALGKVCIAAALTVWGPVSTHTPRPDRDWYRYLWGRLHEGAGTTQGFRSNRLRVITYNYDTSLERYLSRVLANAFPDLAAQGEEAAAAFAADALPIVHLHGSLGDAEAVVRAAPDRRVFATPDFLQKAAGGIVIVHEDQRSNEYATAHKWLREAEAVYLLGFGFHPTNMKRLDLVTQARMGGHWRAWGGTAFGLEEAERLRAVAPLRELGQTQLVNVDCLTYLRAYAAFG